MLGWSILLLGLALVGIVITKTCDDDGTGATIGMVIIVFWFIVMVIGLPNTYGETNRFVAFSNYMEHYENATVYDEYDVDTYKLKMNTWLLKRQAYKETYGIFSLYPDSILELEPIE